MKIRELSINICLSFCEKGVNEINSLNWVISIFYREQ